MTYVIKIKKLLRKGNLKAKTGDVYINRGSFLKEHCAFLSGEYV